MLLSISTPVECLNCYNAVKDFNICCFGVCETACVGVDENLF